MRTKKNREEKIFFTTCYECVFTKFLHGLQQNRYTYNLKEFKEFEKQELFFKENYKTSYDSFYL